MASPGLQLASSSLQAGSPAGRLHVPRCDNARSAEASAARRLQVVQELKRECAGRDSQGRLREGSAVAWSLQRYLVFAILSCIPGERLSARHVVAHQDTAPHRRSLCGAGGPGVRRSLGHGWLLTCGVCQR